MKDPFWSNTFWTILIALMIGAGAGILSTSYTSSYLEEYALELSQLTAPLRLAQPQPKLFPSSLDEAVYRFRLNNIPSLVAFYPKALVRSFGYVETDILATGLVLTSDGWILAPALTSGSYEDAVLVMGETTYAVERVVNDTNHGLVFVKVPASSLSIVGFGSGLDVTQAQQVLVSGSAGGVQIQNVQELLEAQGVAVTSDEIYRTFTIEQVKAEPAFIFGLNGDLFGVVSDKGIVVPSEAFLPQFRVLLETGALHRPSLGVQTISLAHTVGMDRDTRRGRSVGAFIPDKKSLQAKGAAEKAGLKAFDIILAYNGQPINNDRTLEEYVTASKTGDTITLKVDRAGEELELQAVLSER